MEPTRILVVDDDPAVRQMLTEYLSAHGYEVREAASGAAMRAELERAAPAVVLLDIGLPGEDGLSIARYLRERHDVGIIMVTGAGDVIDRVAGLEVGADDYIAKPFDPRELRARLKSVLRRLAAKPEKKSAAAAKVNVGRCFLDMKSRTLSDAKGHEIPITAMEFELLRALVQHPNQVLSRDQLLTMTRNREWEPFDRSIDIRITTPGARGCACSRSALTASCARRSPTPWKARRAQPWSAGNSGVSLPVRARNFRMTISSPSSAWRATPPFR
jgi:two-component system phosphate regulon response regulator OmpR